MTVEICVDGQSLRWYDNPPRIADKSIQFVYFHFNLSPDWDGYEVTAQFDQGNVYNKLVTDGCCYLPSELQEGQCTVSLFGYKAGQACRATAIPLQFDICASGFSSEAIPPIPPDPDLYAQLLTRIDAAVANAAPQLQAMIGNLDDLDTKAKDSLVAAVNEALTRGGGEVDPADIRRIVDEYLAANPPTVTETDPTVPAWAKQPQKPTYTAAEVGALPDTYTPPNQTAQQVGADPAGTAASAVSQHNTDATAHNDLRLALQELANRINAALDSDDTTLDQMSEVVAYIKSNKTLIDAITTSKVSVADIVNDLVTNVADKPLSAAQGVALKKLIDDLQAMIPDAYTLPTATETTLGGVKPVTATEEMTQPVGVDAEGRLMTKPGSGGSGISVTGATVGQTVKISAVDDAGMPTAWEPVDLPSGVGSCKHIETITIPDDEEIAVITFTIPAKTRKLYVVGRTNTSSTFGTYVRPYVKNGNTVLAALNSNQSMGHRSALFVAELYDDIQFMSFSSSNFSFTAAYPGVESFYDYASYFYAENNTFNIVIQSASTNKYFAPGCTFALYALCEE